METNNPNVSKVFIDGQFMGLRTVNPIDHGYTKALEPESVKIHCTVKYINKPLLESLAPQPPVIDLTTMLHDAAKQAIDQAFAANPTVGMVFVNIGPEPSYKVVGVRCIWDETKPNYIKHIGWLPFPRTDETMDQVRQAIITSANRFWYPEIFKPLPIPMDMFKEDYIKVTLAWQESDPFPLDFDFRLTPRSPTPWMPTEKIIDFSIPPLHDEYGQPIIFTAPDIMQIFKEDVIRAVNMAFEQNPTKNMVVVSINDAQNQKFIGLRYAFANKDHYIEHLICDDTAITDEMIETAKADALNHAFRFWFPEHYQQTSEDDPHGNE